MITVLTQKDLYDFIAKNGADAYDQMAKELADNINAAKAKYEADQKAEEDKKAVVAKRVGTLSDLFQEWFNDDFFAPITYDTVAKNVYTAIEDFGKSKDKLMKHAKNVKTETMEIPGGTKTVTTGEISKEDFDNAIKDALKMFDNIFWR